ncbi:MAG TPA: hypothetical protein VMS17_17355, partial [Gemmataceae bacterium]|nr:hypothetical protein [Gemmataceae bacterium]
MAVPHHKEEESLLTRSYHRFLQAFKKPPSRTTWLVLVVLVLIAVLVGAWFWFTASASATSSDLWLKKMETPPTPADLEKFGNSQKDSVQGHFALAEAARLLMRSTDQLASSDPSQTKQAQDNVKEAAALYEKLAPECG